MASVVVDGLVLPVAVGGHAALDFCNTRAGWGSATSKEYLRTHAHLAVWARERMLIGADAVPRLAKAARRGPGAAEAVVDRAVTLRDALYAVLLDRPTAGDWAAVNDEVRSAGALAALTPASGTAPATWHLPAGAGLALPLLAVARSAADLLTSPLGGAVAACPGQGCGWLFADSRGRRRWCSMAWCGNRAKARRHATRSPGAPPP